MARATVHVRGRRGKAWTLEMCEETIFLGLGCFKMGPSLEESRAWYFISNPILLTPIFLGSPDLLG